MRMYFIYFLWRKKGIVHCYVRFFEGAESNGCTKWDICCQLGWCPIRKLTFGRTNIWELRHGFRCNINPGFINPSLLNWGCTQGKLCIKLLVKWDHPPIKQDGGLLIQAYHCITNPCLEGTFPKKNLAFAKPPNFQNGWVATMGNLLPHKNAIQMWIFLTSITHNII